jgi:hypothetical protein
MAARKLRPGERILDIRAAGQPGLEGYQVHSLARGKPERRVLADTPPERFTSRMADAHGEVRVAPLVDALLRRMRGKRRDGA